ncbi:hypothetical protein BDZ89DRAFT_1166232 [Hymenopellis radicata]|nr:hypothetical protein BDZ89DRAFT_1166232 [Hymenopellis radicata]
MPSLRIIDQPSPYASFLGTTVSFSASDAFKAELRSFLRDVKREIGDCQQAIDALRAALQAAVEDKATAQEFYNNHESISPLIHELPTEVMIHIFRFAVSSPVPVHPISPKVYEGKARPFLGMVCRRWRDVLHCTPSLWSSIQFHPASSSKSPRSVNSALLASALAYSQNAPLSFDVRIQDVEQSFALLNQIVSHSSRWHKASISAHIAGFRAWNTWNLELGPLPLLASLTLDLEDFKDHWLKKGAHCTQILESFEDAPLLRKFTLPNIGHGNSWLTPQDIAFPWHQLTCLTVGGKAADIRGFLAACPNLEELDAADGEYDAVQHPNSTVTHEKLRILRLRMLRDLGGIRLAYMEPYQVFFFRSMPADLHFEHRYSWASSQLVGLHLRNVTSYESVTTLTLHLRGGLESVIPSYAEFLNETFSTPRLKELRLDLSERSKRDDDLYRLLQPALEKMKVSPLRRKIVSAHPYVRSTPSPIISLRLRSSL